MTRAPRDDRRLIVWLSLSQLVTWGSVFYTFSLLMEPVERALGLGRAESSLAFSLALLAEGLGAYPVGRWIDRGHERLVMAGGSLCGLAGAYVSVVYTPLWVEGMIAGKGWIALALTTFATWRPARVLLGAYLFGGVTMLQFHLQGLGVDIPSQFLTMLPYLATIVVLVLISRNPQWIRLNMPSSIGKPFHPGS